MAVTIVWFHDSSDLKKPHAPLSTLIMIIEVIPIKPSVATASTARESYAAQNRLP
jgi:hypothetical protein